MIVIVLLKTPVTMTMKLKAASAAFIVESLLSHMLVTVVVLSSTFWKSVSLRNSFIFTMLTSYLQLDSCRCLDLLPEDLRSVCAIRLTTIKVDGRSCDYSPESQ